MAKRENLSDQLSKEYSSDDCLKGVNFAIHKNVMIWGGTLIQLSNISSISQYNAWENVEETYYEQVQKSVAFKDFRNSKPAYKYGFIAAIVCLVLALFKGFFWIPFLAMAAWLGYEYSKVAKINIDVPKTKITRICHYMISIRMNSTKIYNFEIQNKEFRSDVMMALYKRLVEPEGDAKDIQIDLNNCTIVNNSTVNGEQVLIGNDIDTETTNIEKDNESVDMMDEM